MELDQHALGLFSLDLERLRKEADEVSGQWDGDNPGRLEDLAHICNDISDTCKKLNELIDEYNNLNKF